MEAEVGGAMDREREIDSESDRECEIEIWCLVNERNLGWCQGFNFKQTATKGWTHSLRVTSDDF